MAPKLTKSATPKPRPLNPKPLTLNSPGYTEGEQACYAMLHADLATTGIHQPYALIDSKPDPEVGFAGFRV